MIDILTLAVKDFGNAGDNLKEYGGNVTLSGLLIVFAMLVLLVALIWVFGMIMVSIGGKKVKKPAISKQEKPKKDVKKQVPVATVKSNVVNDDENEIIAAISAAVALMYEGTGKTPVIRSIRPAVSSRSAWKTAGIANNTRAF